MKKLFYFTLFYVSHLQYAMELNPVPVIKTHYKNLSPDQACMLALSLKESNKEPDFVIELLRHAADSGLSEAYYQLGLLQKEYAEYYFSQAAQADHQNACYELSKLLIEKQEYNTASYWLFLATRPRARTIINTQGQVKERYQWSAPALELSTKILEGTYAPECKNGLNHLRQKYKDSFNTLFDKGLMLYNNKEYSEASTIFLPLADYKHPFAEHMLKLCKINEQKRRKDMLDWLQQELAQENSYDKAVETDYPADKRALITELAERDEPLALYALGNLHSSTSVEKALDYYTQSIFIAKARCEADTLKKASMRLQKYADEQNIYAQICKTMILLKSHHAQDLDKGRLLCENILYKAGVDDIYDQKLINAMVSTGLISYLIQEFSSTKDPRIAYMLALFYLIPKIENPDKVIQYLRQSAIGNYAPAQIALAAQLLFKENNKEYTSEILQLLTAAYQQKEMLAAFYLACLHQNGIIVPQDMTKSLEFMNDELLDDYPEALCCRVLALANSKDPLTDHDRKTIKTLEMHAKQDYKESHFCLGWLIYNRQDQFTKREIKNGIRFLETAAQKGKTLALSVIGRMYSTGTHLKKNKKKALNYCLQGAESEEPCAVLALADTHFDEKEYVEALALYERLAKNHHEVHAAVRAAYCYSHGYGTKKDDSKKAVEYLLYSLKFGALADGRFKVQYSDKALATIVAKLAYKESQGDKWAKGMLEVIKDLVIKAGVLWEDTTTQAHKA
jgi:TPR repeat protein